MRPSQLWLDFSDGELNVWVDAKLQLAHAKGSSTQRVGFFREIPLFTLPTESAYPMGWTSFHWSAIHEKFNLEDDFWPALDAARFTFLEERPERFIPPLEAEISLTSDVIFFGGTFDPWHEGHRACLELAPADMPVIVCPDRNPHKPLKSHDDITTFLLNIREKALRARSKKLFVYGGFLLKNEPNPTIRWILWLKRHRPDIRPYLLIGFDSLEKIATWTDAKDLMKLLSGLMVVSRLEDDEDHAEASRWALEQNPQLKIRFLGHHAFEHLSSTQMRGQKK
jgi:nicotinic acid mononucleotide adenylyltransferase